MNLNLSKSLKTQREAKGWTQNQLINAVNSITPNILTRRIYGKYERGDVKHPSIEIIKAIADTYEMTIDQLILSESRTVFGNQLFILKANNQIQLLDWQHNVKAYTDYSDELLIKMAAKRWELDSRGYAFCRGHKDDPTDFYYTLQIFVMMHHCDPVRYNRLRAQNYHVDHIEQLNGLADYRYENLEFLSDNLNMEKGKAFKKICAAGLEKVIFIRKYSEKNYTLSLVDDSILSFANYNECVAAYIQQADMIKEAA